MLSDISSLSHKNRGNGDVCVSVYGSDLTDLIRKVEIARSYNPRFIELRLDYLRSIKTGDLEKISRLFRGNEITTFRKYSEGGVAKTDKSFLNSILLDILYVCRPPFIDIEVSTLEDDPIIFNAVKKSNSRLIASSHNFARTEKSSDLRKLIQRALGHFKPRVIKIVRKANIFEDNLRLLSLYNMKERIAPVELIAFCSGSLGLYSRISCTKFGSPFTYASLADKATALGQLDVWSMMTLLEDWK